MAANFKINIPSIPTNRIRFKVQDVREQGFLTKDNRFKDNKEYLTKKFINSFTNLSPNQSAIHQQSADRHQRQILTNPSSFFMPSKDHSRWIVSDNKKNLLIKYEDQYKHYLAPIANSQKYNKGYSFSKSIAHDTLDTEFQKQYSLSIEDKGKSKHFQNYYFNQSQTTQQSEEDSQQEEEEQKEKRRQLILQRRHIVKPSAAFKGEDRFQFNQRMLRNKIKISPGHYNPENIPAKKIKTNKKSQQQKKIPFTLQKMKDILQSILQVKDYKKDNEQDEYVKSKEMNKNEGSNFVLNNNDRFGRPVYPIVTKMIVPGPGSYATHDSIEQNAKKILVLQEQRKLLRQWFNEQ